MPTTTNQIDLLLQMIDEAFEKKTWHGPNLKGSLRGLTPKDVSWRPGPGRHNIREIALHAAYWKYTVRRRLLNEKRGSFPLKGSNWFARPGAADAATWKEELQLLTECHRQMREAIESIPESQLHFTKAGSKYTNAAIIYGIANHDIYHAGQIQLLKRLMKK